jgi:hypothetical protein
MSLNSSAAQPPLSPQQQDTGLPAALPPDTPDVANPSEPEQTEPVLATWYRRLFLTLKTPNKNYRF